MNDGTTQHRSNNEVLRGSGTNKEKQRNNMASNTRSAWKNPSYLQSSFGIFMFFCSWGIWWSFFQRWLISGVGLTNAEVASS